MTKKSICNCASYTTIIKFTNEKHHTTKRYFAMPWIGIFIYGLPAQNSGVMTVPTLSMCLQSLWDIMQTNNIGRVLLMRNGARVYPLFWQYEEAVRA